MPRGAAFTLVRTTTASVSLSMIYKRSTDAILIELCACSLALFVTSLRFCGRAFLGSTCHLMCGPQLRFAIRRR